MTTFKTFATSTAALLLLTGSAAAVTVSNTGANEISIGVDYGNTEEVKKIPAGKSVKLDCKEGCGVTGPWGFSWLAQPNETFTTDGKSMISAGG
jgi:hypothetical protein